MISEFKKNLIKKAEIFKTRFSLPPNQLDTQLADSAVIITKKIAATGQVIFSLK